MKKQSGRTAQVVKDPVCGMDVNPDEAVSVEIEGKTYCFCCEECLEEFKNDPEAYIEA